MALVQGSRLGHYEILAPIGRGGMGEVFRARDTKLERDVAIKVLPDELAADDERVARFEREAKLLASLNHPNIASIHGFEESDGVKALVLELVEGPTLAERIDQGPIPVDEALAIAKQIAEALEGGHEAGVIHRDLKPANIKLREDGTVKVLDYGLAKALESDTTTGTNSELSQSPTLTRQGTQIGVILGTAAYMSPEQAKGKGVDKKADIWAFGVVLYEMVTGRSPFASDDLTETIASVVKDQPDLSQAPPLLRKLLSRCLEKDPRERLRDIGDVWLLVDDAPTGTVVTAAPPPSRLPWVVALLMTVVALTAVTLLIPRLRETRTPAAAVRFELPWPVEGPADPALDNAFFNLSSDGQFLAMVDRGRLWVRPLDAIEARVFDRTEGATYPFWSPDGAWIGFFADGQLKKVELTTGSVQTLCEAEDERGGAWSPNGTILFGASGGGLWRVPEQGGTPEAVTTLTANPYSATHRYPQFLPDGEHFLYLYLASAPELSGIYVGSLDGSAPVRVLEGRSAALHTPAASTDQPGHLLFRRQETLMAQPFDPGMRETIGPMFQVADGVGNAGNTGHAAFAIAADGTLAYSAGTARVRELVWLDRTGSRLGAASAVGNFLDFELAPDEGRVVVATTNRTNSQGQILLQDLPSGSPSTFTFGAKPGWQRPVWSPDGSQVAFSSFDQVGHSQYEIRRKSVNMSGSEHSVLQSDAILYMWDWSPDGALLLYSQGWESANLMLVPLDGEPTPIPLDAAPGAKSSGQFSPEGRFVAYVSNQNGGDEVYVQPYPATGALWQVSTGGGSMPRWRRDGRELFFRSADGQLMAVAIGGEHVGGDLDTGAFERATPQPLFEGLPATNDVFNNFSYQPSADGERFLVSLPVAGSKPPITVVLNWQASFEE